MVKSLFLEVLNRHVDVVLRDTVIGGLVSVRLIVGLNYLKGLFQPTGFYDSKSSVLLKEAL